MAANMARLGNRAALVACVGNDNLGVYLKDRVAESGVETHFIATHPTAPTSIVVVSRTKCTPDFIAYREADCWIKPEHLPDDLLKNSAIFHTTCFALSRPPAQDAIVDAARRACEAGCQVSIDANYAPTIWPDRDVGPAGFAAVLFSESVCQTERRRCRPVIWERPGTGTDCNSFSRNGRSVGLPDARRRRQFVSYENGHQTVRIPSRKIEVIDATGAGDAYWAGFLTAWLDGHEPAVCARAGANLAEKN
jgi:sugar/nucleoside kinase (ribokinase family)